MIYKMLPKINEFEEQVFARIDDDGKCRITCVAENFEFKKAISEETAQLQDAEGNLMTAQAAKDFIKELP